MTSARPWARGSPPARVECEALNTLGVATCYLEDETVGLAQIQAALALAKACGDSH